MSRKAFHFKHFHLYDDKSTMKVGTDSIILGIWAKASGCNNILDIGTGCGILALMLAQRSDAQITAIDIDKDSVEQAKSNFISSPWSDRITALNISLQDFCTSSQEKFELIVSNPPYFTASLKPENNRRKISRHTDSLSFDDLCLGVGSLLSSNGNFYLVLPFQDKNSFIKTARNRNLFLHSEYHFIPKREKQANRAVMGFSFSPSESIEINEIVMRESDDSHSKEFMHFTDDYYIFSKDEIIKRLSSGK